MFELKLRVTKILVVVRTRIFRKKKKIKRKKRNLKDKINSNKKAT